MASPTGLILKKTFGGLFTLMGKAKFFSITLVLVIIIIFHSATLSMQQHSWEPIKQELGYRMLAMDNYNYVVMTEFEQNGRAIDGITAETGIFMKLYLIAKKFFDVAVNVWFLAMVIYAFYYILVESFMAPFKNHLAGFVVAMVIVLGFQSLMGVLYWSENGGVIPGSDSESKAISFFKSINPIKGNIKFIQNIPYILNPMIEESGALNVHEVQSE